MISEIMLHKTRKADENSSLHHRINIKIIKTDHNKPFCFNLIFHNITDLSIFDQINGGLMSIERLLSKI